MMRRQVGSRMTAMGPRAVLAGVAAAALSSCGGTDVVQLDPEQVGNVYTDCNLNTSYLWVSLLQDGIPSLDNPQWDQAELEIPEYVQADSRIIGIEVAGTFLAVPHNVLWHHEIANLRWGDERLALTYCPITGSSLVFDRNSIGGAELGVSGVQFMGNLVMYDRQSEQSLWPQLMGEARCGNNNGTKLTQYPMVEMEWASWLDLHPDTWVLSGAVEQGFDPDSFDYFPIGYPYFNYEEIDTWFNGLTPEVDRRLHLKERVIGLPSDGGDPGIAFPFGALEGREGSFQTVPFMFEGKANVLLWSDEARGGTSFVPLTENGVPVSIVATDSGFEDEETRSTWTLDGWAVSGPMEGERLQQIARTHTAFWGAWAMFHPQTRLWQG